MTDTPLPPQTGAPRLDNTRPLREATDDFSREYLELARAFGQIDIQVAREFAQILEVARTLIQTNPQLLLGIAPPPSEDSRVVDVAAAAKLNLDLDFIKNLISRIIDFFLGDKEFFLEIFKLIKCDCPKATTPTGSPGISNK